MGADLEAGHKFERQMHPPPALSSAATVDIELIDSKFYSVCPACDVIKTNLIINQDSWWLVLFVFQNLKKLSILPKLYKQALELQGVAKKKEPPS